MEEIKSTATSETPAEKPDCPMILHHEGTKTYLIGLHFSGSTKETMTDKIKRLIRNDVETDNF